MAMAASAVAAQSDEQTDKKDWSSIRVVSRAPAGTTAHRDLEYARVGDKALLLDLYVPNEPEGPLPLLVWIHGGAWRAGSKDRCPAVGMTRRGYVVASVGYRLSQEARFPAQIHDCKAAIRWLRAHADTYKIDPGRIGAWGTSAGGHLVALLGTSGGVEALEGTVGDQREQSSRIQAACDFFGPTDFLQMDAGGSDLKHNAPNSPESQLIGGAIQENKDKVARANPITYVTKDDPPFLIVHGDKDRTVPINQSELLSDALKKAGVEVEFYIVKGGGHGFRDPMAFEKTDAFFDKHLKTATKPEP
jgi:acetyl esterase/lipase